jgi:hypothetical protein
MTPDGQSNYLGPVLAFCVGATKAGTTWLYHFLKNHPDCHMRSIKELHYFDALDFDERRFHLRELEKRLQDTRDEMLLASPRRLDELEPRLADVQELIALHQREGEDTAGYLDYLNGGRSEEKLIGDVTPAYSLLSAERFGAMAALAPVTRFVYVMRDPVARLWSHLRMNASRRARVPEDIPARVNRMFWRYGRGRFPGMRQRGDYRATLERLNRALDPSRLLVLFYEELFRQEAIDRLCVFLGIAPMPAPIAERAHVGPDIHMTAEQRRYAQSWLAPQYTYVQDRFGRVPDAWRANMPEVIS